MIKREQYMKKIRPFIGNDLIKVLSGMRRSGKSIMLELIKDELITSGVNPNQFISFNFEAMNNSHLCNAKALHDEIINLTKDSSKKSIFFLMKFKKLKIGKDVLILFE